MWSTAELDALREGAVLVEQPWLLALAGLAVIALVTHALWRGPLRVRVPEPRAFARVRRRWSVDWSWLASVALRGAALALVACVLAGPVGLIAENPAGGSGLDLVIALDASGSMDALDGQLEGRRVTRLELARHVVAEFVRQREGDRIGIVTFGEHAFTQCPLTADHRLVQEALARIEVGVAGDATAIGEAIGLATKRLHVPGSPDDAQRILVLVTDGRHNSGQLGPETAAQIARLGGVRIHTVGIGSSGVVPFAQKSPGEPLRFEKVDLDETTLRAIAQQTGGRYFHARRPEDLRGVAEEIDALERKPQLGERRFRRASLAPHALLAALLLLACEALLAHGLLRRLP